MDNRKIVVYHNKIVINNYTPGDIPALESIFDIYDKNMFMFKTVGAMYDRINKTYTIPRGMSISKIENIAGYNVFYENGCYIKPKHNSNQILIKYPPKDEKQALALKFLSGNGEYKYTKKYNQLFLALNTGAGKTYLGLVYTALLNVKTIIITSNVGWLNQWKDSILEHTNIVSSEIKFISGSSGIISILTSDNKYDNCKIFMITHDTIATYAKKNGWESIDIMFRKLGIGLKIIDEAHLNFENIWNLDYASPVYKTLYLTATPCRGDDEQNRAYQEYFKCVPMLDLFDTENDPHTHYIALLYKSGMTVDDVTRCHNLHGFSKTMYCDSVILRENFDYISRIVMDMISAIPGKKLFFFATNNAVVFFYNWIRYNYSEYSNDIGVYTSINPDKDSAKDNTIILTTSKSAGACLDIKDLMVCINMAEPTKSPPQNQQRFGRTRAYNSFYIDVVDTSVKTITNYYKQSLSMYDKYALDTKEIVFNKTQLKNTAFNVMEKRFKEHGKMPFERIDKNGNKVWW
jgi:hypothetical protein